MDWRDSNIILGEQMNTRGYDASTLLASHKGVGILRPDGETDQGADVLAITVRTYYMSNGDWQIICQRGRALREAAGTLTGHAAGEDSVPIRCWTMQPWRRPSAPAAARQNTHPPAELPEPLASVVGYLADDLYREDGRTFVPTAELVNALDIDIATLSRQMSDLGCRPTRVRLPTEDGTVRQVRGYLTANIRAAADAIRHDDGQIVRPISDDG